MKPQLPIEMINKILVYVSELNGDMIILQYDLPKMKEFYKINFLSDSCWKIQSTLVMKRIYPVLYPECHLELYRFGIPHYTKQLREKKMI